MFMCVCVYLCVCVYSVGIPFMYLYIHIYIYTYTYMFAHTGHYCIISLSSVIHQSPLSLKLSTLNSYPSSLSIQISPFKLSPCNYLPTTLPSPLVFNILILFKFEPKHIPCILHVYMCYIVL